MTQLSCKRYKREFFHMSIKLIKNLKFLTILFEISLLILFWLYFYSLYPNELIIHKTGKTPDSFISANYLFFRGVEYFLIYLLCTCILIPIMGIKNFLKILPQFFIFGLYVFTTLILGVLSLNIESIFIDALMIISLIFVPIFAIYLILCIITLLAEQIEKNNFPPQKNKSRSGVKNRL